MSEVIFKELERGGDECYEWFKERKELYVYPNSEDIQNEVRRLVNTNNNFGLITRKNEGDPYVIALAVVNGAVFVTNEASNRYVFVERYIQYPIPYPPSKGLYTLFDNHTKP